MKSKFINLSFAIVLAPFAVYGQNSFEECQERWQATSEMAKCEMKANEAKKHEISAIIKQIEKTFKNKDQVAAVLDTQNKWEEYIESECRSRMIPGASGSSNAVYLHSCIHDKLQERIRELKQYHDCYVNGCPERIDKS